MDGYDIDAIMIPSVLALIGWLVYLMFRRYQVNAQIRLKRGESLDKLIEKFGNAKEFVEFVQTDEGKRLLTDPVVSSPNPLNKVLRFVQAGILFFMIGVAYWVNAIRLHGQVDPNYVNQMMDANYWGTLALFLGLGCLVVAGITYFLTRSWHLVNGSSTK